VSIQAKANKHVPGAGHRHDSKYASTTQDVWDDLHTRFFKEQMALGAISEERARLVCKICENVSYSKEVKRIKAVSAGL
jgi:hypothetical protein